jgi:hypothetical protein
MLGGAWSYGHLPAKGVVFRIVSDAIIAVAPIIQRLPFNGL